MTTIAFGIIAHDKPDVLEHQTANLRHCSPTSTIRVFNGGESDEWCSDISVPVSSRSHPLRYHSLARAHHALMVDLVTERADFDWLIVLDNDMMLIKRGLEGMLNSLSSFAYVGTGLAANGHQGENEPERTLINQWPRYSALLNAPTPWTVGNPGQIFRRDLVEHLASDASIPAMLDAVEATAIWHPEEFVWPTLAISRGFPATANPGTFAIEWRHHTLAELTLLWANPHIFLLHKVSSDMPDAADRRAIDGLARDGATADDIVRAAQVLATETIWRNTPRSRFKYRVKMLGRDLRTSFREIATGSTGQG